MPVCFNLTRKSDIAAGPVKLNTIDEEMCKHFGAPVDEVKYHCGWFDSIGFRLATGKTWEDIRKEFRNYVEEKSDYTLLYKHLIEIVDWLEDNFVTDSWYELKSHSKDR